MIRKWSSWCGALKVWVWQFSSGPPHGGKEGEIHWMQILPTVTLYVLQFIYNAGHYHSKSVLRSASLASLDAWPCPLRLFVNATLAIDLFLSCIFKIFSSTVSEAINLVTYTGLLWLCDRRKAWGGWVQSSERGKSRGIYPSLWHLSIAWSSLAGFH